MIGLLPARRQLAVVRVALLVVVVGAAYHHSLSELAGLLASDTPLAYLALVPPLVLGMGIIKARAQPREFRLPDRQVDWIIGIPLLAVAGVIARFLPDRVSYDFWVNRLDLLGLPFFVAGGVAILFGSRVLYRVRLPIAALILAWPYPYQAILDRVLSATSVIALWGVRTAVPLLDDVRELGGPMFSLGNGAEAFRVNVAPTCAGANSVLGFVLVGGAALCVLRANRRRKLAWLASGVALMLVLNLLRLVLLFWVGSRYGETAAMNWLHPYAGLVLFGIGICVLMKLLPRFGIGTATPRAVSATTPGWRPVTRIGAIATVVPALVLATLNGDLRRYQPFSSFSDSVRSAPITGETAVAVDGWVGARYDEVTWARQYFGRDSTWTRYGYTRPDGRGPGNGGPLYVDVVSTSNLGAFSRFGLEACYRFHGYRIARSERVEVGAEAPAQAITFAEKDHDLRWLALSWVSPVAGQIAQSGKRYERVVLLASTDARQAAATERDVHSFARALVRRQGSTRVS